MPSQCEAKRQVCFGAMGASALLGLNACSPQLFMQTPGPTAEPGRALRAAAAAPGPSGPEPRAGAGAGLVLGLGATPVLSLGAAGAAVLAVRAAAGRARAGGPCRPLRAFEGELGVQPPFGFWDPLGLAKDGDADAFRRRRATELKHGRVSMLACLGYITPEYFKFPGYCSPSQGLAFSDIPNGLAALSKVPGIGWVQMIAFAGSMERSLVMQDPARAPGDFEGVGALGVPNSTIKSSGEARTRKLNAEIANGRLAMMAIIGMFYQDGLTGSAWGDWSLYADSPLRAFENELGVQEPVGFWDPVGFTNDGDEASFKRRRSVEIKHGRICMLATMGYITPEITGKFPGYLSPSSGLQFADIPNGLGAISKVPAAGWLQIIAYMGFCEFSGGFDDYKTGTPGDYGIGFPNFIGKVEDPEAKESKLAAEIANGRLAMVAIIGMFFQDGLTGSAWGDWALYTDSPLRAAKTA